MTVESWWQVIDTKSGMARKETFVADNAIDNDLEKLLDVLLLRTSASPRGLYGLPAEGAIEEALSRRAENEAKAKEKREG